MHSPSPAPAPSLLRMGLAASSFEDFSATEMFSPVTSLDSAAVRPLKGPSFSVNTGSNLEHAIISDHGTGASSLSGHHDVGVLYCGHGLGASLQDANLSPIEQGSLQPLDFQFINNTLPTSAQFTPNNYSPSHATSFGEAPIPGPNWCALNSHTSGASFQLGSSAQTHTVLTPGHEYNSSDALQGLYSGTPGAGGMVDFFTPPAPINTVGQSGWGLEPSGNPLQMMQPQVAANCLGDAMLFQATPTVPFPEIPFDAVSTSQRTPCSWEGCQETFTRSSDLDRHIQSVHLRIRYHYFWPECPNNKGEGYCRLEKLRAHQKKVHGVILQ
ncbi:hypothetical protein F5884DRAFT_743733 [Xylogone sp. PMI_703]|nr:hypothetical protein F5884DRAFT_743733 [Xylogone sp. PMI_703]